MSDTIAVADGFQIRLPTTGFKVHAAANGSGYSFCG
jgi:hypothetical protein